MVGWLFLWGFLIVVDWLGLFFFFPFLSYPFELEKLCVHQMILLVFLEVYDILFYVNSYSSKVGVLRSYTSVM